MKNKRWKDMLVGGLIACLLCTLVIPAAGALVWETIQVRTGVGVYVDDQRIVPRDVTGKEVDVFIYNGTTYLPARAISNVFGKPIVWEDGSIYIGKHESTKPAVMLKDLDYFAGKDLNVKNELKDNLGNSYVDAIALSFFKNGDLDNRYLLNGNYSKMTGTFFLPYESRSNTRECFLKIYGDGILLYNARVTGGVTPIDFSVDLSGVLEMQVVMATGSKGRAEQGGAYGAIGNCALWT